MGSGRILTVPKDVGTVVTGTLGATKLVEGTKPDIGAKNSWPSFGPDACGKGMAHTAKVCKRERKKDAFMVANYDIAPWYVE